MTDRKPTSEPASRTGASAKKSADLPATLSQANASIDTSRTGAPVSSRAETPVPKNFGRYKIEKELGKGAMGVVYLAEDTQLHRKVALKIPKKSALEDPESLERFYREARTTATIRHNNICPVYDVGAIEGVHYLTMAYIPGKPVSSFLGKGKRPAPKQVALLIRKIALALDEAHRTGVVHRDLKPSNVMLDDRGEPIVMDFGLACQVNTEKNARLTQSGAILGTPAYMAPEQVRGEIDRIGPASDIYALGVMLYQFLTGELPFSGPIMMVFAQIITEHPKLPSEIRPDVDPTLAAICQKMMAKEISQRYASMKDVATALTEYIKTGAVTGLEAVSTISPAATVQAGVMDWNELPELPDYGESIRKTQPKRKKSSRPKSLRWLPIVGGGAAALTVLCAVIIILVRKDKTTVRIEADPQSVVKIDGNQVEINPDGPNPVRVSVDGDVNPTPTASTAPPAAIAPFNAEQAKAHQEAWAKYLGVPVEWENSIGMKFRLIPPGEFMQGISDAEFQEQMKIIEDSNGTESDKKIWATWPRAATPRHKTILTRPFYLGMHEVTQRQYREVTGENPSAFAKDGSSLPHAAIVAGIDTSSHPVESIDWNQAVDFCEKLSQRERLTNFDSRASEPPAMEGIGYRMPTEAQWEFACQAGTITRHWGKQEVPEVLKAAWVIDNCNGRTHPVGELTPNPFGLYDMFGNVNEWTGGAEDHSFYLQFADRPAIDPRQLPSENHPWRPYRGGGLTSFGRNCDSSGRVLFQFWAKEYGIGFRVALSVDAVQQSIAKTGWPPYQVLVDDKGVVTEGHFDDISDTRPGWKTENGELRSVDNNDKMLNFGNKHYGDFQFTAEYKIIGKRGAVFIAHSEHRGDRPKGYSVGLGGVDGGAHAAGAIYRWEYKSGNISPLHAGDVSAGPKLDEWATLEVTLRGSKLTAKINGKLVSEGEDKNNEFPTGRLAFSLPYETVLCLRSVKVRELPADAVLPHVGQTSTPTSKTAMIPTPGFSPLFNGIDFTGWNLDGDANSVWKIVDGQIVGSGNGLDKPRNINSLLTDRRDFRDFHLRAELKLDQGNSGLFYIPDRLFANGYEAELGLVYQDGPYFRLGSLIAYDDKGQVRTQEVKMPPKITAGEWMTVEWIVRGNQFTSLVNGTQVATWTDSKRITLAGRIGLTNYSPNAGIVVRKLEIKEFPSSAVSAVEIAPPKNSLVQLNSAAERAAAEWALKNGAVISIWRNSQPQQVARLPDLPKGDFQLQTVMFGNGTSPQAKPVPISREGWNLLWQSSVNILIVPQAPLAPDDIATLAKYSAIYKLTLRGTSLTNHDLKQLAGMSELQTLNLSSTKVDGRGLETLQAFPKLSWLDLSSLKLRDADLERLASLKLETLLLDNIPLTDKGLQHLKSVPLTGLYLDSTRITDRGIKSLPRAELQRLILSRTAITNQALDELEQFPNLTTLVLTGTKVTGTRVRKFAERHPECTVIFTENGQQQKIGPKAASE